METKPDAQAVRNCSEHPTEKLHDRYSIPKLAENLYQINYELELDQSAPLDPELCPFTNQLLA